MLTFLPVKDKQIVLVKKQSYRTHRGCMVETEKRAFVYVGTLIAGEPMEHVTLSAHHSIFENACLH